MEEREAILPPLVFHVAWREKTRELRPCFRRTPLYIESWGPQSSGR